MIARINNQVSTFACAGLLALAALPVAAAPQVQLSFPLGRAAYGNNEWIPVVAVRGDAAAVPAGDLTATLTGPDGGSMACTFVAPAVAVAGGDARTTEGININGWLLKPGRYTLDVTTGGGAGKTTFTVGNVINAVGVAYASAAGAAPAASVKLGTPTVVRDYTLAANPIHVEDKAVLFDAGGNIAPFGAVKFTLTDPTGHARYAVARPAAAGSADVVLPLALNDAPGLWTLTAVAGSGSSSTKFNYTSAANAGALMGLTTRAFSFGDARKNIFDMFRINQDVTIVKGSSDFESAQADRLVQSLAWWDVRATVVPAAGFTPTGPYILIGNPTDNPLIAAEAKTLPAAPVKDVFPGRGRGYLAFVPSATGATDSASIIGYDAAGITEGVGTFYEAVAGLDPLTPFTQPTSATYAAGAGLR